MDVKSVFNNMRKVHLGKRMKALGIVAHLIWWTMRFTTDRQVKIVLDGEAGEANPVDPGVPQGSRAAPILFVTYLSGIFDTMEQAVPGARHLRSIVRGREWVVGRRQGRRGSVGQAVDGSIGFH